MAANQIVPAPAAVVPAPAAVAPVQPRARARLRMYFVVKTTYPPDGAPRNRQPVQVALPDVFTTFVEAKRRCKRERDRLRRLDRPCRIKFEVLMAYPLPYHTERVWQ